MHTPRLPHCLITAALLPALLAGCVSAPKLGPKPAPRPLAAYAATQTLAATPGASAPAADWWRAYADPQLTALIEEGLASAPDVAIAVARLRQAEGYHQQAGAALLPRLDAKVLGQEAYIHDFPGGIAPNGWAGAGAEALQLSFDIDLWGKNRAALRAARHEDEAAALDLAQARLTLSTAIASSYADLARLYAERDVQAQAVQVKENTRRMVADRVANGLDTQAELKQAEAAVPTAQADLLATDEQIALARNTLAALLGKGPDRGLAIARPAVQVAARGLPANASTDLIARRPDVAAALARVQADDEHIREARAGFYPALSISGLAARPALSWADFVKGGAFVGGVGPSVSLPIFHGGEIKGKYRTARGTYDEAVANYDKTLANAFHEVADAAASQAALAGRLGAASQALTDAEGAYAVARQRYEGGLSTYLNVLSAEEQVLSARRLHADLAARAFTLDVALVRALGGGVETTTAALSPAAPAPGAATAPSKDPHHG